MAVLSHAGFYKVVIKNKETLKAGAYFHQLHHRYFEFNYGSEETPVDRWCGTFHDGASELDKRFRLRKKVSLKISAE